MNRQLDDDERKITERNLLKKKEDLIKYEDNLNYNKALINKQTYLRDFDDEWREYLRKQKDNEDIQVLTAIYNEIKQLKEIIKITEEQLKEGVKQISIVD